MWILFVVSTFGQTDIKLTRYAEYESAMKCSIEQSLLEIHFENNEEAICLNTTNMKVIK
tara:strand:+ start:147 stop:323 length:177 start_codon:yes stop_codon:yes gene_type:complete